MLKKSTSEDIKTWKTRSSVNTWKVTGKTLDLDGKYSSSRPNFKNGLQYAKSAGNLRQNAILSRQHQAIEQLEKKKGRLNSIMEVISPFDKVISSSNKKISSKYNKPTSSRKLVKEIFPPPNVPEAAEYGLPVPIYNHNTEAEVVDLPQPPWFALKVLKK